MNERTDDRALLMALHGALSDIDPIRWRDEKSAAMKARLLELRRNLGQRERLATLAGEIDANLPQFDESKPRWLEFKKRLQPAYEAMAARFRAEKLDVPSLRPTNWPRSAFHLCSAAVAIALIQLATPTQLIAMSAAWAAFAWACEFFRRRIPSLNALLLTAFRRVAHQHESYRVNSATWYATGLFALALLQSPVAELAAVSILGVGDPMAGLIGRRFGRIKLVHGRSLEGTLAFFVTGAAVSFALLSAFHPTLSVGLRLGIATLASAFGAVAELFSSRIDDNLLVPLAAASGAMLAIQFIS